MTVLDAEHEKARVAAIRERTTEFQKNEFDSFTVKLWLNGFPQGDWHTWMDWQAEGDLSEEVCELWAMVRAVRDKIRYLYGTNGPERHNFVFPAP